MSEMISSGHGRKGNQKLGFLGIGFLNLIEVAVNMSLESIGSPFSQSHMTAIAPRGVNGRYRAHRRDYKPHTSLVYQCGTLEGGPDATWKNLTNHLSHLLHQ